MHFSAQNTLRQRRAIDVRKMATYKKNFVAISPAYPTLLLNGD
jgi:hypothetical protein